VDNFVVRHLTVRYLSDGSGPERDCIFVNECSDYIFDHISASWASDEIFSISQGDNNKPGEKNGVAQRCLMYDGLDGHNTGSLTGYTSFYNFEDTTPAPFTFEWTLCVWTGVKHRTPNSATAPGGASYVLARNNVVSNTHTRQCNVLGPTTFDLINCTIVPGINNRGPVAGGNANVWQGQLVNGPYVPSIHSSGNHYVGELGPDEDDATAWRHFEDRSRVVDAAYRRPSPVAVTPTVGYVPVSAAESYKSLVTDGEVGHNRHTDGNGSPVVFHQSLDEEALQKIRTNTTTRTTDNTAASFVAAVPPEVSAVAGYADSDKDGMPDVFETAHGLNPSDASDMNLVKAVWTFPTYTVNNDAGYHNIEMYLAWVGGCFDILLKNPPAPAASPTPATPPSPTPAQPATWSLLVLAASLLSPPPAPFVCDVDAGSLNGTACGFAPGTTATSNPTAPYDFSAALSALPGYTTAPPVDKDIFVWARTRSAPGDAADDAIYVGLGTPDRVFAEPSPGAGVFGWNRVETVHNSGVFAHGSVTGSTQLVIHRAEPGTGLDALFFTEDTNAVPPNMLPVPTPMPVPVSGPTGGSGPSPTPSSTGTGVGQGVVGGDGDGDNSGDSSDALPLIAGIAGGLVCLLLCIASGFVAGRRRGGGRNAKAVPLAAPSHSAGTSRRASRHVRHSQRVSQHRTAW
jgi:hypothetical protein